MRATGWLIGCGLTVAAGCAVPSITTERPNVGAGTVAGTPVGPGAAALTGGTGPGAAPGDDAAALIAPPDAWRRPVGPGDPSDWQRPLRVSELPANELERLSAIVERRQEELRDVASATVDSLDRLDNVDAELARAEGAEVTQAWLERRTQRLSTVRLGEDHVVFGFKGATGPARTASGPTVSADIGNLGLPAKVQVGMDLGDTTPGLAAVSEAVASAKSVAAQPPGLDVDRPTPGAGLAPQAQGSPARLNVSIADRDEGGVGWWVSGGVRADSTPVGAAPGDGTPEAPVAVDAGVQYELSPDAAVAAVYGYRGGTEALPDTATAQGQRADEQLHNATLRLIWRFARPTTGSAARSAGNQ
jgi:hypothetical protein